MKTQYVIKRMIILASSALFFASNAQTQTPYTGTPIALPGTIEAENYDIGGQAVSYYDVSTLNLGGKYRTDQVDIETCLEGGYNIHKMEVYEWLEYTINLTESTGYNFDFRVASTKNNGVISMTLDGNPIGTVNVPNTGGMQTWRSVKRSIGGGLGLPLAAGVHVLRVSFSGSPENNGLYDMFNLDKIIVTKATRYPFIAQTIPGVIEAEYFDLAGFNNSGESAYNDLTAGNSGGATRNFGKIVLTENVDMETCSEGGTNVGWIQIGEWLEYTVNIMEEGTYTMDARVASNTSGGSFQLNMDGNPITGVMLVPNTGGWQQWINRTQTGIALTSGTHILRVKMTGNEFNLNKITFTKSTPVIGCTGTFGNDYSYVVSAASTNPTITFNPVLAGVGSSLVILYYGNGGGAYPGYIVTPGVPFQITATAGQNIYFYYTYSYPTGGERNSSASPHHVSVGNCGGSSRAADDVEVESETSEAMLVYPNPMGESNQLYIASTTQTVSLRIVNAQGEIVFEKKNWNTSEPLNLQDLDRGLFQIVAEYSNGEVVTSKIIR